MATWADATNGSIVIDRSAVLAAGTHAEYMNHFFPSAAYFTSGSDCRRLGVEVPAGALSLRGIWQVVLPQFGLIAVYRHGVVVITTPEAAANWSDKTGVEQLRQRASPAIRQALESDMNVSFLNTPLGDLANNLSVLHSISILCLVDADMTVTLAMKSVTFGELLALLLDDFRLVVFERHGVLIITWPDGDDIGLTKLLKRRDFSGELLRPDSTDYTGQLAYEALKDIGRRHDLRFRYATPDAADRAARVLTSAHPQEKQHTVAATLFTILQETRLVCKASDGEIVLRASPAELD